MLSGNDMPHPQRLNNNSFAIIETCGRPNKISEAQIARWIELSSYMVWKAVL